MEAKRKKIRSRITLILVAVLAAGMVLLPYILRNSQAEPEDKASYLTARAVRQDIRSTISGGGTLAEEEGAALTVPRGVEVLQYLVSNGDWVEEGQPLALVDGISAMQTIATLQKNLEYLSRQIQKASDPATVSYLSAPAGGRVKQVFAQPGDEAAAVMAEHGALAVLSLDGLMALDVETAETAGPGDAVTVTLSDGTEKPGRIERRQGDTLTVTLTDDGPRVGDVVLVSLPDGTELGSGTLRIHSALNVTAASGVVTAAPAREERAVYAGDRLFNLSEVDNTGEYRRLCDQRREYEDVMLRLFNIYQAGALLSPASGRISGLDTAKVGLMRAGSAEYTLTLLSGTGGEGGEEGGEGGEEPGGGEEPAPDPDPNNTPAGLLKNKYAMVSEITFGSITFMVQDESPAAVNYRTEPAMDFSRVHPETFVYFGDVTIYDWDDAQSAWKVIYPSQLQMGDMLYFVYDGEDNLIWMVRAQPAEAPGGGFYVGGGGGGGAEEPFELYDVTPKELLQVVPQNVMTVKTAIDELDILSVALGQEAEVTVDALPGRAFTGVVTQIDPVGQNSGGNSKYTITITVDRDPNMLRGMNATTILTVGVTENVLTLPVAAMSQKGSRTIVYTGFDEQTRTLLDPVEISLGVSDGTVAEIVSGLEEGDTVWYSYYESGGLPVFSGGLPAQNT